LLLGWYTFLQKFVKRCTFGVPSTPKYTKMVHPVVHLFTYTRFLVPGTVFFTNQETRIPNLAFLRSGQK